MSHILKLIEEEIEKVALKKALEMPVRVFIGDKQIDVDRQTSDGSSIFIGIDDPIYLPKEDRQVFLNLGGKE